MRVPVEPIALVYPLDPTKKYIIALRAESLENADEAAMELQTRLSATGITSGVVVLVVHDDDDLDLRAAVQVWRYAERKLEEEGDD